MATALLTAKQTISAQAGQDFGAGSKHTPTLRASKFSVAIATAQNSRAPRVLSTANRIEQKALSRDKRGISKSEAYFSKLLGARIFQPRLNHRINIEENGARGGSRIEVINSKSRISTALQPALKANWNKRNKRQTNSMSEVTVSAAPRARAE